MGPKHRQNGSNNHDGTPKGAGWTSVFLVESKVSNTQHHKSRDRISVSNGTRPPLMRPMCAGCDHAAGTSGVDRRGRPGGYGGYGGSGGMEDMAEASVGWRIWGAKNVVRLKDAWLLT
ncbi:hypothetical protein OUZ56_000623 [Daphnia magna]|uniref:Uncharacterized protein n=1 Tax=Daphnia magna TaxID=35525 RepID=A0ABR0A094_9CRUS|nr:hypothetical protein OUZ56_000623 [Daphnia magna]